MSQAGSQAAAFYRDVARTGLLWTVCDEVGFPQPLTADGYRAQPFWSSLARAARITREVPAYRPFSPHQVTWAEFVGEWAPELAQGGVKVGVNWSGRRATGYDVAPAAVVRNVEAARAHPQASPQAARSALTPARIRALRRRLGLTRAALAAAVGVSAGTVARWERGEATPSAGPAAALQRLSDPRR